MFTNSDGLTRKFTDKIGLVRHTLYTALIRVYRSERFLKTKDSGDCQGAIALQNLGPKKSGKTETQRGDP